MPGRATGGSRDVIACHVSERDPRRPSQVDLQNQGEVDQPGEGVVEEEQGQGSAMPSSPAALFRLRGEDHGGPKATPWHTRG